MRESIRTSTRLALALAALAVGGQARAQLVTGANGELIPDYFGIYPNYATSALPQGSVCEITTTQACLGSIQCPVIAATGLNERCVFPAGVVPQGGIRKFVDALPALTIATPDTTTYPGHCSATTAATCSQDGDCPQAPQAETCVGASDYYEIELRQYAQQMHSDLPPTTLRGYVQVKNGADVAPISYLGPVIVAQRDRPVRVKFTNKLPTGTGGDLFIPVDTTYMGAGDGPIAGQKYTQNRATIHLHGATTPWISDGTTHQWITPAGETTVYPKGVSARNVPDMPDPGPGSLTFFYTNQQSARLMFYHDHAYGLTRLNVYAGEAAGYLVTDAVEQTLINGGSLTTPGGTVPVAAGTLPGLGTPLVIQDRTFVPGPTQLAAQDPTWNTTRWGGAGQLWYPHVYMPNQNPYDLSGANAMGRWDYGPWFWPPFTGLTNGPIDNPYKALAGEPPFIPGTPDARGLSPSGVPEAFMDTPVVNGKAYPTLNVPAGPVRFRILNASDDRYWNLSLWVADPAVTTADGRVNTEVKMVPFNSTQNGSAPFPSWWYDRSVPNPFDDRVGGVPDPATRGPAMVQIGTEGGFLPAPAVIRNQPVNYVMNKRDITVGNVREHALFLGPAERADVVVDFANFAGKTLILYNDAPAPVPAADPRLDYFTGAPDQTDTGGAPSPLPGYGPNTRTIMQIVVGGSGGTAPVDDVTPAVLSALQAALPAAFAASQESIIVPQAAYNQVYSQQTVDKVGASFAGIQDTSMSFTPYLQSFTTPLLVEMEPKSIIEDFQPDYGRMNALLGVEIKHTNITNQTSIPQTYGDPPTELVKLTADPQKVALGAPTDGTQIWKITHNGVDTHAMHFHMFHVQIVNRVGWDGAVRPPEPNELGWKDTVRMNPLEDIIVALRPRTLSLPFKVPNSIRPLNPALPIGSPMGFTNVDPQGNPVTVLNQLSNFGWEYVWHCHLLGHEENDMMRALVVANPPEAPSNLVAAFTAGGSQVDLTWTDNSLTANGFMLQRATDAAFTQGPQSWTLGNVSTFTDPGPLALDTPYYYRVVALNTVGSTIAGYPTTTAESAPSSTATAAPAPAASVAPTALAFANQAIGTTSAPQAVTLSNTGSGTLTFTTAVTGDFATSNACGGSVAPGASCAIDVTFTPTAAGARAGSLAIGTNDPARAQIAVPLSGTGVNAATIAIDRTVSRDLNTAASSITGPALTTTGPNRLLLAFVSTDAPGAGTNTRVTGVTNTGGALTWVLVRRTNAQRGTAEVWRAFAPTARTATVTARFNQSVSASSITVVAFSGTSTAGTGGSDAVGATASASSAAGAPSASLVSTRANSWVFGVGTDWDRAVARTLGPNQTMVHQDLATVGDTYWVQRQTSLTPTAGTTVTIDDTAPAADRYNLTIVEVRSP